MIMQWYWAVRATAAEGARKLGLARESARHMALWKRNEDGWRPHLRATREFMLRAAREASRRDTVLVAGSGWCLDVPLAELSALFKTVMLLDAVHPRQVALEAARLGNVILIHADLTGCLVGMSHGQAGPDPVRLISTANLVLPGGQAPDLTISANTMAQLPLAPGEYLWRTGSYSDDQLAAFATDVIQAHKSWLESLPGVRCLITDHAWLALDPSGETLATDPLHGVVVPAPAERWNWNFAPCPQAHPSRDIVHSVGATIF